MCIRDRLWMEFLDTLQLAASTAEAVTAQVQATLEVALQSQVDVEVVQAQVQQLVREMREVGLEADALALESSAAATVLPLELFQPEDSSQLEQLWRMLRFVPQVMRHYLSMHIFPECMEFQRTKISACGHELASDILFGHRIGFSGTPSYLLPLDFGECGPEPGSDGKIVSVLTSSRVVTAEVKEEWTAHTLLADIAKADPPFHALIDTGALVTGLTNEEVADVLLSRLPATFKGVVYLDRSDRQMILLRNGRAVPLAQSGLAWRDRFTFYDQVHTTGMDIKQFPSANAVVTIGKDMTFRDFAQGSFRMRNIGAGGQHIHLYIISEVAQRIKQELSQVEGLLTFDEHGEPQWELAVSAWLMLNSMYMEGLQYMQLNTQEMHNIWRKQALKHLLSHVEARMPDEWEDLYNTQAPGTGIGRFSGPDGQHLSNCVNQFREPVNFDIEPRVPVPHRLMDVMAQLEKDHTSFLEGPDAQARLEQVLTRARGVSAAVEREAGSSAGALDQMMEQEQEQEQENEQEVTQQIIKEDNPKGSRDDEAPHQWRAENLNSPYNCTLDTSKPFSQHFLGDLPFYPLSIFQINADAPSLQFPDQLLLSGNWFRPQWIGLGDRRLKNVELIMEWQPPGSEKRQVVALTLAEGETVRRIIHTKQEYTKDLSLALHTINSFTDPQPWVLDQTAAFESDQSGSTFEAIQCLRFFSGEMYYKSHELQAVAGALKTDEFSTREDFFRSCMDRRRTICREFKDTPVAKLFLAESEWDQLRPKALINWLKDELVKRNPHKLLAQRQRQVDFLKDKLRKVPALSAQLRELEGLQPSLLMLFTDSNKTESEQALAKLSALDYALKSAGYTKLAVETGKMLSQMRYAMNETWGDLNCKEIFDKIDTNHDGVVSEADLDQLFRHLGMPHFASEDLSAIFRLANPDGSSKMTWKAFEETFDIPDPTGSFAEMSADDTLVATVESMIEQVMGYHPGGSFATAALNHMAGEPFGRCKDPGAAVAWFMEHTDDWFMYDDQRPINDWHEISGMGGGGGHDQPPPGFHWKCFTGDECQAMGGIWNRKSDLFCTICKQRNPGSNSNWG
eukprot:TRINITY_DN12285_c0_g1_i4.p1 TRINITY_DN12285_c0_g1~~TRINITY_DN12285_c0_g1_i4.p1  ORF type:complete len:1077 (+),score=272.22 TRINITY_DN12285_c0_g1_i4:94-3324(+)